MGKNHGPKVGKLERKRLVETYERVVAQARASGDLALAAKGKPGDDVAATPLRWFVVTVTAMCEKAVASRLKRRFPDMAAYYPIARRRVRRDGRSQTVEWLPMPRYLFIGFEREPPWLWIFDVQGVQSVLGIDNKPCQIDAGIIGELIWRCETNQVAPPAAPVPQRGMQVVAKRGLIGSFEGTVKKVHKQTGLAEVFFDMVGGSVQLVTMRLDDVVSVSYA